SWQQDGNLLKAVVYLEQAAPAAAAAPPQRNAAALVPTAGARANRISGSFAMPRIGYTGVGLMPMPAGGSFAPMTGFGMYFGGPADPSHLYQRLAEMYRQLGRKEAAAGIQEKIRALLQGNEMALASFYERQDQPEEAAALYQKLAGQTANP